MQMAALVPTLVIFVGHRSGSRRRRRVVVVLRGAEPAGRADLPDPGRHVLVGVGRWWRNERGVGRSILSTFLASMSQVPSQLNSTDHH